MSSVFLEEPSSINNGHRHFHCNSHIPVRYVLAFLSFLGLMNVYMLRVNLSLALVVMVDDDAVSDGASVGPYGKVFQWTATQQGLILGSFYYGYILTQIPGGWLAHRYGAKYVFGIGVVMTALLTLLTPNAASVGVWCLVMVRIMEGIFQGVTFPAMHALWSVWAPPSERSILMTFSLTGQYVGSAVAFPLSAVLCEYGGGWASVFYVFGIIGLLWSILWMVFAYNSPASHPHITEEERIYIESCLSLCSTTSSALSNSCRSTPWLHIFTSPAVWAIVVAHFCGNFGFSVLLTTLPTYFRQTLQLHADKGLLMNGLFSSIPYITETLVVVLLAGPLADILRAKCFSTQTTRKLFSCLSLCAAALFLILCGYYGTTKWVALIFLTISVAVSGFQLAGHCINHADIAPRFSGVLMGITNSAGTIPGIIGPQIAKAIAHSGSSESQALLIYEWRNVFIVTAEIYLFGAAIYAILGRGERQWWSSHYVPVPVELLKKCDHHYEQLASLSIVSQS